MAFIDSIDNIDNIDSIDNRGMLMYVRVESKSYKGAALLQHIALQAVSGLHAGAVDAICG